ncbi:MAG: hypothetical protein Q9212_004739 [Teloschistes hypoglaucus]
MLVPHYGRRDEACATKQRAAVASPRPLDGQNHDKNHDRFLANEIGSSVRSNGRSTTSNLLIPSPRWEGKDSMALGASQKPNGVPYNPNLTQSQNVTGLLQKDSLDSFRVPEIGLNGTKADREMASMPSKHAVTSWDDMIPLSCQKASDRPHRPHSRHHPGIIYETGVLGKPTAGETTCNLIEVDSGHDSSDDSGSDSEHEASSATISTCGMSPGVSSSNEGQMKNTETGGKEAEGLFTTALNSQEQRDNSWLDIDHFFNSDLEAKDGAAEGKCQETGNFEDKPGPDGAKDGQAGDGSQGMHHSYGGEDAIADPEMEGLEVDIEGFYSMDGHGAGVRVDADGEQNPFDGQVLEAPVHSSPPCMVRIGRGRPPRSRTAITICNGVWKVTKIAGDEQSGEGRILKVQAEAWLAEEDLLVLQEVIAAYRDKQGRKRGKRKKHMWWTKEECAPKDGVASRHHFDILPRSCGFENTNLVIQIAPPSL